MLRTFTVARRRVCVRRGSVRDCVIPKRTSKRAGHPRLAIAYRVAGSRAFSMTIRLPHQCSDCAYLIEAETDVSASLAYATR